MRRHLYKRWYVGLVGLWLSVQAPNLIAEEDQSFQLGGLCSALAYTTGSDLAAILLSTYADDLASFCVPEEPLECSDYSSLLKGKGRFVTGEDGYHCTLHLSR